MGYNELDYVLFGLYVVLTPIMIMIFTGRRFSKESAASVFKRYKLQVLSLVALYWFKGIMDWLNDPIRDAFGLNFTHWMYAVEGDMALQFQRAIVDPLFMYFMGVVYLLGYLFLFIFSFFFTAYLGRREQANQIALGNYVVTAISIPFYLFFPVFVTSWPAVRGFPEIVGSEAALSGGIEGMRPLMYTEFGPWVREFFIAHDPFDNCFPSLHIAVPFMIFMILWRSGHPVLRRYAKFVLVTVALISISIVYLGVHWIIDIPAGFAVSFAAFYVVQNGRATRFWDWLEGRFRPIYHRFLEGVRDRAPGR